MIIICKKLITTYLNIILLDFGLNTFLVLIFVVFVADGSHFDIMFKMVLIFYRMFKMVLIFAIHVLFGPFL